MSRFLILAFLGASAVSYAQNQPPPEEKPEEAARPDAQAPAPAHAGPNDSLDNLPGTPEAKELFGHMLETFKNAQTLTFRSKTTNAGTLAAHSANTDVAVRMRRLPERAGDWQYRITGSAKRKPDDPPTLVDVVLGPGGTSWLDHQKKTLTDRPRSQGNGPLVQMAIQSIPTELLEKSPFGKELNSDFVSIDASETVDGVDCRLLTFKPKRPGSTTRVWVATTDYLPRRFERVTDFKNYANTTTVEFSAVRAGDTLSPSDFKLELPDGYTHEVAWQAQPTPTPRPEEPATPTGGAPTDVVPITENPRPTPAPAPAPPPLPPAPAFDLVTPAGEHVTLEKLRGSTVLLYFWGTWSIPGHAGLDEAQKIHDDLSGAGVRVLAVAVRERTKDAAPDAMKKDARTITLLVGGDRTAAEYGVAIFPTFVVIDPAGAKVGTVEGFKKDSTPAQVRALIDKARGVEPAAPPAPPTRSDSST